MASQSYDSREINGIIKISTDFNGAACTDKKEQNNDKKKQFFSHGSLP